MTEKAKQKGDALADENLKRIRAMQHTVREHERDVMDAKAEFQAAKQQLELERGKLAKFIETTAPGHSDPLFKDADEPRPAQAVPMETPEDDSWKEVLLSEVLSGLPKGIQESIAEAQIKTMDELSEFTKHKQLTDIPGIGPTKAAKIEEALEAFWKRRADVVKEGNTGVVGPDSATKNFTQVFVMRFEQHEDVDQMAGNLVDAGLMVEVFAGKANEAAQMILAKSHGATLVLCYGGDDKWTVIKIADKAEYLVDTKSLIGLCKDLIGGIPVDARYCIPRELRAFADLDKEPEPPKATAMPLGDNE